MAYLAHFSLLLLKEASLNLLEVLSFLDFLGSLIIFGHLWSQQTH